MERVQQILSELGEPPCHPKLSVAWIAEDDDGGVHGILVLQSLPIVEPCLGEDAEVVKGLFDCAEQFIKQSRVPRILAHTSHRGMQAMLLRKGAKKQDDPLFDWRSHV
jgi:hypothetical protein